MASKNLELKNIYDEIKLRLDLNSDALTLDELEFETKKIENLVKLGEVVGTLAELELKAVIQTHSTFAEGSIFKNTVHSLPEPENMRQKSKGLLMEEFTRK
jgi:hypothetical protein